MAIKEIIYDDKVDLQLWGNVSDVNKIKADDMNEIKNTVNNNAKELILNEDNQIHIKTEQSSTINVQDCSNLSAKIDILGVSEQETRSGKNLLDISLLAKELANGISYTYKNDKIHIEGTATAIAPSNVANVTDKLEIGEKYILSLSKSNNDNVIATASIQYNDETPQTWVSSFTFAENMQAVNIYLQVSNGTTVNVDVTAQLEKGEVATEYEKYGASPSPKFPSEIENVVGDIDITVCNKNLFDGIFEEGTIDAEGNLVTTSNVIRTKNFIKANGLISISYENALDIAVYAYDINKNFIAVVDKQTTTSLGLEKASSYNLPQTTKYIKFRFNSGYINLTTKAQVEKSNIATDYIEHEEQIKTFPLKEGQKMYEGSKTEDDEIHHIIKQIELDGTENVILFEWTTPHNKTTMFKILNIIAKKTDAIKFCNYFKVVKNAVENLDKDEEYCLSDMGGAIAFSISNDIATTVEQFKTWLAQKKQEEKPVLVEYQLLEEEVEPYTEAQQEAYNQLQNVTPYKLVTNISTDKAKLVFKYIADTKTYIDNKVNNMQNQLNTINELLSTANTSAMLLDNLQTDLESEVL